MKGLVLKKTSNNSQSDNFHKLFDEMEAKIKSNYQKIVRPPVEEKKVEKKQAKTAIGGGGGYVTIQKDSFDLVLNVLLGMRRALADLSSVIP